MEESHDFKALQGSLPGRETSVIQKNHRNRQEEHQHSGVLIGIISANCSPTHVRKESKIFTDWQGPIREEVKGKANT